MNTETRKLGIRYACIAMLAAAAGIACRGVPVAEEEPQDPEITLGEALESMAIEDVDGYKRSSVYFFHVASQLRQLITRHGGTLEGANVIELGPGQTLGVGLLFLLQGASSVTAVDVYEEPTLYDEPATGTWSLSHAGPTRTTSSGDPTRAWWSRKPRAASVFATCTSSAARAPRT